jgi:hypothetical protein
MNHVLMTKGTNFCNTINNEQTQSIRNYVWVNAIKYSIKFLLLSNIASKQCIIIW